MRSERNMTHICLKIVAFSLFACLGTIALAQPAATADQTIGSELPPSLVQTVEPSFRIEPIVHRFTGRRGEIIPFEFTITSLGKPMNLKIFPVNLRQEESGIILHDQTSEPSEAVKMTSPREFRLIPGESKKISGNITIPIAKTNYLSFGILVQDQGQDPNFENIEGEKNVTKAGIRFVTQYVLRVDLETGNADPREFGKLRLQKGTILSSQGLPLVKAYLDNPTEFAFECQVRAKIKTTTAGKPRPFFLGMPSRSELEGDDRYLIRIMPKSRLRLETLVDFPLFTGPQSLVLGLSNGRREVVGAEFSIDLSADSFPALESQLAYVGDHIAVSPSQIEIGTTRGASRMLGMKFINSSPVDQSVSLHAKNLAGEEIDGLKLSPSQFTLRAGRTKNVRVQVKSLEGITEDSLGEIRIEAHSKEGKGGVLEGGEPVQQALPLVVRRAERQPPNLSLSDIQFVNHGASSAFQLVVKNEGASFIPVNADLEISDRRGRAMHMSAGYGKWIRPGQEKKLLFLPETNLPSGEYLLSLAVKTYEDLPAETRTLEIKLKGLSQN